MIQFNRNVLGVNALLGVIVICVKSHRPGNISLLVAIAGPVTLTRATTNTNVLLHIDGMHRVSFYFLKIPMDRMPLPPGSPTYTHAHRDDARMHTPSRKRARSTHNTGEEEKARERGRRIREKEEVERRTAWKTVAKQEKMRGGRAGESRRRWRRRRRSSRGLREDRGWRRTTPPPAVVMVMANGDGGGRTLWTCRRLSACTCRDAHTREHASIGIPV